MGFGLLSALGSLGKKGPPPPEPPPELSPMEVLAKFTEHPTLSIILLVVLVVYTLLKIKASSGPKPGKAPELDPEEYVVYKPGEPVFVTDSKAEAAVRVSKKGVGALAPSTLPKLFASAAKDHPTSAAVKVERGGKWLTWSWSEYYAESRAVSKALISLGFEQHDCVNVIGFNSPEWFMAEMGAILAGGKAAGVYTTNEPDACKYVAEHSDAVVIFLEDEKQLKKYNSLNLPKLKAIVMWMGEPPAATANGVPVYGWKAFQKLGEGVGDASVDSRSDAIRPGHCATLIYTSGTTGNPKAVMISHDNIIFEALSAFTMIFNGSGRPIPKELRIVSYLPLSHVAGQMLDIVGPLIVTGVGNGYGPPEWATTSYCTWFARPDALKGTLKETLLACRPTFFLGVPRVWEKFREALLEIGRKNKGIKAKLSAWAKRQAVAAAKERQLGGTGHQTVSYLIAKKLLSKVKDALGLDQAIACLTAAAPMPREVAEYFASIDIDILDVYGMSECTGATTASTAEVHQFGTVGYPITPAEVKIDHQPGRDKYGEGEICYRGRHIMMGYMKDPKKTAEAIDSDGWLHSGDVGMLDQDKLLHITGRIKELIITAGGENIAPVPIEDKLKELLPAVSNVMMVGDQRKYNVCLLTLKTVVNPETGISTGQLTGDAARVSDAKTDNEAIAESKNKGSKWEAYLSAGLAELNAKHSVSNAQKIQKYHVLPGDFSEKGGELTPTLKLKRTVAAQKYKDIIDAMY